jgi:hypothetical protein
VYILISRLDFSERIHGSTGQEVYNTRPAGRLRDDQASRQLSRATTVRYDFISDSILGP